MTAGQVKLSPVILIGIAGIYTLKEVTALE
jgi:hypothetical protein